MTDNQIGVMNDLAKEIHDSNVLAGWWTDLKFKEKKQSLLDKGFDEATVDAIFDTLNIKESTLETRNVGELLCLTHSELSEAMEGYRKKLMDDKLPHRTMFETELADVFIRLFDIVGSRRIDIGTIIAEKRQYNAQRADHKPENRVKEGGKQF